MHRCARKLIVSATLLLAVLLPGSNAFASSGEIQAKLTEAHGDVFKRGFVDWEKEIWEDPSPAQRGDVLHEGMQIGTGTKSWAQLSWPNVTARAWANSLYAIAPQQRLVYLLNGEMLYHLDKNRKDKKAYVVWTKLIQARIRGTTVLFQTTGDTTRMTVLEGTVEVMNRIDKSIVRITPGVVYEVKDKLAIQSTDEKKSSNSEVPINTSQLNSDVKDKLSAAVTTIGNDLPTSGAQNGALSEITANVPVTTLFETKRTLTSLFVINPQSLLSHPLLTTLEQPLSSLPLVQSTLTPLISKVDSIVKGGIDPLNQQLLGSLQVLTVPKSLTYKVGPGLGTAFVLPQAALSYFPPTGYIGNAPGTSIQTGAGPNANGIANGASTLLNGSASLTQTTNSLSNLVPGGAFGGFQGGAAALSNITTNAIGGAGVAGLTGGGASFAGGGAAAMPMAGGPGGTVGALGGTVGGVVGGVLGGGALGGTVGGVVGGTVHTVTNVGGAAVGGVQTILPGLGGGLGGLLGH